MKEKRFTLKKTTYDIFKSRERNYLIENKTLNELNDYFSSMLKTNLEWGYYLV